MISTKADAESLTPYHLLLKRHRGHVKNQPEFDERRLGTISAPYLRAYVASPAGVSYVTLASRAYSIVNRRGSKRPFSFCERAPRWILPRSSIVPPSAA